MIQMTKSRKVERVDLHQIYSAKADYSHWTKMDGYWHSRVAVPCKRENWDDYSAWIQQDKYFEANIQVNSNGEDWNDFSNWTQQDKYFKSDVTTSRIASIPREYTSDYLYWLRRDEYFSLDNLTPVNDGSWYDFSADSNTEASSDVEDENEQSLWLEPGIVHSIAVYVWHDYCYRLDRDEYFRLKNWPSFDGENWDSEHDDHRGTFRRSNDKLRISSVRGSEWIGAFPEDVSSESGFYTTNSGEDIESSDDEEKIETSVLEPRVGDKQLIGDDFFMQLARWKYSKISAPEGLNAHGTVRCGISIAETTKRFDSIDSMSEKLVICLGAVDVISGSTADMMIGDMRLLLEQLNNKFGITAKNVTLCTVPPLPNLDARNNSSYMEQLSFNNWIVSLEKEGYQIISFDEIFTKDGWEVDFDFYSKTKPSDGSEFVFQKWNIKGQQRVFRRLLTVGV